MISDRLFLRKFVLCSYDLLDICVETNYVDFEEFYDVLTFVRNKRGDD